MGVAARVSRRCLLKLGNLARLRLGGKEYRLLLRADMQTLQLAPRTVFLLKLSVQRRFPAWFSPFYLRSWRFFWFALVFKLEDIP